jgi:hypothetical protein
MDVLGVVLTVVSVVLAVSLVLVLLKLRDIRARFRSVVDADAEGRRIEAQAQRNAEQILREANAAAARLRAENEEAQRQKHALKADVEKLAREQDRLAKEVHGLEESLEDISFGIYKPHFAFDAPEDYKAALQSVVDQQRQVVRAGRAVHFGVTWTVGGSRREGERMQKQYAKLLLRAFNGECDAAIGRVSWNNAAKMEERIRKALDAINKLGGVMQIAIVSNYMDLRLSELRLKYEWEEKKREVVEEQRRIREELREQEKARRELEAAQADAEAEESRFTDALNKARVEMAHAQGEEHARLTARILELEAQLAGARERRERVSALAELTRSGYVYFLSNIGSFGDKVFKIGLTRRLDPQDRVKELSDASVPFGFDVHAMVYSEDAPALERAFHEKFADRNINLVNPRKEFFRVSIEELQEFANERGLQIAFTRVPEAREYRETVAASGSRSRAAGSAS